jgi:hypothetical protein
MGRRDPLQMIVDVTKLISSTAVPRSREGQRSNHHVSDRGPHRPNAQPVDPERRWVASAGRQQKDTPTRNQAIFVGQLS